MSTPYQGSPNPNMPDANAMQPPQKSGGGTKTCLIIGGIVGVLGLLVCGGCFGFMWWGVGAGMKVVGEQVQTEYTDHEVVVEKLGGIDSIEWNMGKTQSYAQDHPEENPAFLAFKVSGPKGDGVLYVQQQGNVFTNGRLEIDGEEFPLE